MIKIKLTYLHLVLSCLLCLMSFTYHAQTKSTDVKTINGKKYYIHKVQKGQSLYAISKLYEIDINSILAENDDAIDGLKNGQELKIPTTSLLLKTSLVIDTNKYQYHKIEKRETIYSIGKKYNIDEKKLTSYNPTIVSGLKEGEYIIVGEKKKKSVTAGNKLQTKKDTLLYTVAQNETVYSLSKKFGISQNDIIKWNPTAKTGIKQGEILKLLPLKNIPEKTKLENQPSIVEMEKQTADSSLYKKPKKTSYTVGLFLPFKLAEINSINIDGLINAKQSFPPTQSLAIDFYTGFKKAVDSLSSKDFDITIKLFDVDEKDSSKIEEICRSSDFKQLDIMFGPLYASGFKHIARKAKELGIASVSPLTQQNKILFNNPLSSKVNPSQLTLIEGLADFCADSLIDNSNIMIVNSTAKDQTYIKTFKNRYIENLMQHSKIPKDSLREVKGLSGVKVAYQGSKKNVVVLLTNNLVYIQDFITQLAVFSDKKDIILLGFSSICHIDNLDQTYLNDLQYHYATANHIDFSEPFIKRLAKEYQESYFSDPSEYYFEAYDIATYYLSNLKTQGPSFFLNLDKTKWDGISSGFKFYRPDAETGFENRSVFIYRYSNYKLQKLGWK